MTQTLPKALSIAGSDPSGGAGIQADLKTFSALGVYGTTAITALVDENTMGVYGIHPVPIKFVENQIRSVLDDTGANAIKIGMLHDSDLIQRVVHTLKDYPSIDNIVLDPVMVATSGDPLLELDSVETLKRELIPYARIITPNIPEATLLLGEEISRQSQLEEAALNLSRIYDGKKVSVLIKAGHLDEGQDFLVDIFYNAEKKSFIHLEAERIHTNNTHGTGCTLSSAIAAFLAKGEELDNAVIKAKNYLSGALRAGSILKIGKGHGPVHHFYSLW